MAALVPGLNPESEDDDDFSEFGSGDEVIVEEGELWDVGDV